MAKRQVFSRDFKLEAVRLLDRGDIEHVQTAPRPEEGGEAGRTPPRPSQWI